MNGKGLKHGLCIDLPENEEGRKMEADLTAVSLKLKSEIT